MLAQNLIQAYKQAPWRLQVRRGILILLTVVAFVVVAVIYLNISARTYDAGLKIQKAEYAIDQYEREISDLTTQLALLTSSSVMEPRARELGFSRMEDPNQIVFIVVPGYSGRQLDHSSQIEQDTTSSSVICPEYTQSLWEFLFEETMKWGKQNQPEGLP
jgi:cell division protein FtsL